MKVGLGIIDTDLCLWASSATPAMVEEAILVPGHPVVKAKPAPISMTSQDWLGHVNCWVSSHPWLTAAGIVGGYLLLRKRR